MVDYSRQAKAFEIKCLFFYEKRLNFKVLAVSDKAVRAQLEIPGWKIDLAKDPRYHATPEQAEWRKSDDPEQLSAQQASDFLIEAAPNHWIIAEAKSSKSSPDPHFLDQLSHTLRFARLKKPDLIVELHLVLPDSVDPHHLFTRQGIQYSVEAPFRYLADARAGRLASANGTYRISGISVWVVMLPSI